MNKIKSNVHMGNKHFVWGVVFVVFALVASVVWGLTYAEDTTVPPLPTIPLPVVNLVGTLNGNSVVLTWTNTSTNQNKFNISRSMNGGSLIGIAMPYVSDLTSYTDSTVTAGNTYAYKVEACLEGTGCSYMTQTTSIIVPSVISSGGSNDTTTINTTTTDNKPLAPTNLTATVNGNNVILNWTDNSNNEAGFKIYRGPVWTDIGNVGSNVTSFTDTGRPAGTYTYRLNAFNSLSGVYSYSPISNDVSVTVGGTTSVVNTNSTTCTGLNLTLNDGKTSYTVGQSVNYTWTCIPALSTGTVSIWLNKPDGSMINYNTGTGSNTQTMGFSTSNLVPGNYVLKACLGTSCTTVGTIITAQMFNLVPSTTGLPNNLNTSNITIPLAPSNLRLDSIIIPYNISLSWNDNSNNEDKFIIEKKLSTALVWSSIAQVGTNTLHYIDTKVVSNTPYDYRISACLSGIGCSGTVKLEKVYATVSTIATNTNITTPTETTKLVVPSTTTSTTAAETIISKTLTTDSTATLSTAKLSTGTTTTSPNVGTASTTTREVKEPVTLEVPKEIIENVTMALNIISKSIEISGTTKQPEIVNQEPVKTPEEIKKEERVKQEVVKMVYQDTNKDGISDYDSKYVYNMDPVKPSSVSIYEGKNINAGEKILLGFDPAKKELEKIVAEEPTIETKSEIVVTSYKVNEVSFVDTIPVKETTPTKETLPAKEIKPTKAIKLKGVALPNSFLTIYIYSTPIMVTVKTDKNGEWNYTLDKELENGNHTVYTATVNNTGNIVAKSAPFTFVKTAEAVTLQDVVPVQVAQASIVAEKPGFLQTNNIFFAVIGTLMMSGITLILIGLFSKKST